MKKVQILENSSDTSLGTSLLSQAQPVRISKFQQLTRITLEFEDGNQNLVMYIARTLKNIRN